jgi:hypothetical protein
MNPPARKKTNDVTKYMRPICFASVVRRIRASALPGTCRRNGPMCGLNPPARTTSGVRCRSGAPVTCQRT